MNRDNLTMDLFAEPEPEPACSTCVHLNPAPSNLFEARGRIGSCTPRGWRMASDPPL